MKAVIADSEAQGEALEAISEQLKKTVPGDPAIEFFHKQLNRKCRSDGVKKGVQLLRRHVAVVFLSLLVVSIGLTLTVSAVREQVIAFLETLNGDTAYFKQEDPYSMLGEIDYPLEALQDYRIISFSEKQAYTTVQAQSREGQRIYFYQGGENVAGLIDTENASLTEEVEIHGCSGLYTEKAKLNSIIWEEGGTTYALQGNLSKSSLLQIADSVVHTEKGRK